MGGAPCCEGNVTPAAEFNIWVDPEAASIVFRTGLPIELVGCQLSLLDAMLHRGDIEEILALRTRFSDFAIRCTSAGAVAYQIQTGEVGISLPDPIAMAILLDPGLCTLASKHFVAVEAVSELTRGMTVVDRLCLADEPRNRSVWADVLSSGVPAIICWSLDVAGWKAMLLDALS